MHHEELFLNAPSSQSEALALEETESCIRLQDQMSSCCLNPESIAKTATNNVTTVTNEEAGASGICRSRLSIEESQNGINPKPITRTTVVQTSIFTTERPCLGVEAPRNSSPSSPVLEAL